MSLTLPSQKYRISNVYGISKERLIEFVRPIYRKVAKNPLKSLLYTNYLSATSAASSLVLDENAKSLFSIDHIPLAHETLFMSLGLLFLSTSAILYGTARVTSGRTIQ